MLPSLATSASHQLEPATHAPLRSAAPITLLCRRTVAMLQLVLWRVEEHRPKLAELWRACFCTRKRMHAQAHFKQVGTGSVQGQYVPYASPLPVAPRLGSHAWGLRSGRGGPRFGM